MCTNEMYCDIPSSNLKSFAICYSQFEPFIWNDHVYRFYLVWFCFVSFFFLLFSDMYICWLLVADLVRIWLYSCCLLSLPLLPLPLLPPSNAATYKTIRTTKQMNKITNKYQLQKSQKHSLHLWFDCVAYNYNAL